MQVSHTCCPPSAVALVTTRRASARCVWSNPPRRLKPALDVGRIGYGGAASKRPRVRRNLPSAREHPAVGGKNNPLDRSLLGSS